MSKGKHPQRDREAAREPVRRGQLGVILSRFNDALNQDFGLKTATALTKYHMTQIEPRFQRMEKLPWNWLAFRVMDLWFWCRAIVTVLWGRLRRKPVAETAPDAQAAQQAPGPPSDPEPSAEPTPPLVLAGDDIN